MQAIDDPPPVIVAEDENLPAIMTADWDEYETVKRRARNLLESVIPLSEQFRLNHHGYIEVQARSGWLYRITPFGQTHIYDNGKLRAQACLQLSIPAPVYDRMLAEYILIRGDEARYLKTANLFGLHAPPWRKALELALIGLCSYLASSLAVDIWLRIFG